MSTDGDSRYSLRRDRKLTEPAHQEYIRKQELMANELNILRKEIESHLTLSSQLSLQELSQKKETIETTFSNYLTRSAKFVEFLRNTRSEDCERELYSHNLIVNALKSKVHYAMEEIRKVLPSRSTKGSSASRHSSISTIVMQQRAKAEAAQTQLRFAREEAALKKAQAEMQLKQMTLEADKDRNC